MSSLLLFVAALWLLTALIHGLLGTREILNPVLRSEVGSTAKAVSEVAWHIITWQFLVLAGAGAWASTTPSGGIMFAYFSFASALGAALLFIGYGWRRFGNPWRMPQWALFLPIAALSMAHVKSIAPVGLADVARVSAAALLVTIGLLHAAWALGSAFPARSKASLARHVVGVELPGNVMPGRLATWIVAVGLLVVAACVLGLGLETSPALAWGLRAVAITFVGVFTLRGVLGFFEVALRPAIRNTPYMTWSRALYSPLSLLLALLIAVGAQS